MMETEKVNDGHAQLMAWNASIHFNENYVFARLDRGGDRQLPEGFSIHPTSDDTHFRLFSEPHDTMMLVATCAKYGGSLAVNGLALKRAMAALVGVGEPVSRRPADVAAYFDALIATAAPFRLPAPQPMDRGALDAHLATCGSCSPLVEAMAHAIDGGRSLPKESELRDIVQRAHDTAPATTKPARRAAQPLAMTTEA